MAARNFLVPVNFNKNEIQNAVAQVLASAPSSPVPGQFYYDSAVGRLIFRGASAWIDPTARANHTGTQLAATISDFDNQVRTSRLDQMAAPTASVSFNSQKITNLLDGTSAQDAVTFVQLQNVLQGRTFKDAVRAASQVNGTLSTAFANGQVIDGVTLATGDRILIRAQTTGADNGIYVVQASGAPVRATDADATGELRSGSSVLVAEGTVSGDKQYTLTTDGTITVGTTAQVWTATGTGTTYTAGTGISIAGSVISIDTAVTVRKFAQDIGDGSTTSIAVTHGLGTLDVQERVWDKSTGATVECDAVRTSTTVMTFIFSVAPTTNQFRVSVQG